MEEETVQLIGKLMLGIPIGSVLAVLVIVFVCVFIQSIIDEWRKNKWQVIGPVLFVIWFIVSLMLATYRS
jgi:hypothetical protein